MLATVSRLGASHLTLGSLPETMLFSAPKHISSTCPRKIQGSPAHKLHSSSAIPATLEENPFTGGSGLFLQYQSSPAIARPDIPCKLRSKRSAIYCQLVDSLLPPVARNRKVHGTKVYFWDSLLGLPNFYLLKGLLLSQTLGLVRRLM